MNENSLIKTSLCPVQKLMLKYIHRDSYTVECQKCIKRQQTQLTSIDYKTHLTHLWHLIVDIIYISHGSVTKGMKLKVCLLTNCIFSRTKWTVILTQDHFQKTMNKKQDKNILKNTCFTDGRLSEYYTSISGLQVDSVYKEFCKAFNSQFTNFRMALTHSESQLFLKVMLLVRDSESWVIYYVVQRIYWLVL